MVKKFGSLLLTVVLVCSCLPYAVHAQGDVSSVISAGSETSFVVKKDRSLWGTGSNEFGQLGLGHKKEVGSFTKIMEDVVSVSAARYHTIALKRDGTLWGFGDGGDRRLPGGADLLTPAKILEDVKAASAGTGYTAAIKNDGTLWICGNFSLGDGENNSSDQFEKSLDDVKLVFAGDDNCLVIKNDDSLWIWGENSVGQIGNGSVGIPVLTATKVMDNVATAVAGVGVMAVKKDGSLWIWGASGDINNANGETPNKSPVPIKMMDGVLQVCTSANSPIYFAMKRDGTVWGVGSGHVMNSLLNKAVKQFTAITDNALSISSESRHLAVVKKDQTLWIGGQSVGGRLGYGNAEKYDHHKLSQVMTEVLDAPAPWALEEVRAAEYRKLVPPAMQSEYTKIVTRSEFCTLAITCIEQMKKMSIQDYLMAQNFDMPEDSPFTDINGLSSAAKADIMAAYALGIVNGTTSTTFSPNNQITREQAAKMLTATAAALGHDTTAQYPAFSDEAAISAWAKPYIGFVFHVKIMSGVGNNEFDPHGGYQRQQAYMTMLRLYNYCFIN